jgi:dolichyl-diphosphooligosaccharide--protein glycosyltransferase
MKVSVERGINWVVAYTTENMIVRIYQVKKPDDIGRSMKAAASFGKKRPRKSGRSVRSGGE